MTDDLIASLEAEKARAKMAEGIAEHLVAVLNGLMDATPPEPNLLRKQLERRRAADANIGRAVRAEAKLRDAEAKLAVAVEALTHIQTVCGSLDGKTKLDNELTAYIHAAATETLAKIGAPK